MKTRIATLFPFILAWTLSMGYLGATLHIGWIPHDEGTLAHAAERVLAGELPHRDFDDLYTGALSFLHAGALWVFGRTLLATRLLLLGFSGAFIAALYAIARRLVRPWTASLVTLVGVSLSLPNYFAAMPSWYNLFCATVGTWLLFRYLESGQRRWLFLAGLCGGLSITIKVTGLYFVAACGLFLLYRDQLRAQKERDGSPLPWRVLVVAGLTGLVVVLTWLVSYRPRLPEIFHFFLPGFSVCALLLWTELHLGPGTGWRRPKRLLRDVLPLLAGVAVPVLLFLVPYFVTGSLADLVRGTLLLPQKRMELGVFPLPPAIFLLCCAPLAVLALGPLVNARWSAERLLVLALGTVLLGLLARGSAPVVRTVFWEMARGSITVASIVGCLRLALRPDPWAEEQRERILLLLCVAVLMSLVQVPHGFWVYFCYVAPLAVPAMTALADHQGSPRKLWATLAIFFVVFPLLGTHRSLGTRDLSDRGSLTTGWAALRVPRTHSEVYGRITALVRERSTPGSYIYAAPDCPEIYFLTERKNPTRTLFDFFDSDYANAPKRRERIMAQIRQAGVQVVVVDRTPSFSGPLERGFEALLRKAFPQAVEVGSFTVRWRGK